MLAALGRGTDGILFLLRRSTAIKMTFEESINSLSLVESCWCPRASLTEQTLQNTKLLSWEKSSLTSF